jgi:hypothetical protein
MGALSSLLSSNTVCLETDRSVEFKLKRLLCQEELK